MPDYKAGVRTRKPTHPGQVILAALEELRIKPIAAAPMLDMTRGALSNIITGKSAVTPKVALKLGKFFDNGHELWMNLQADYDIWQARQELGDTLAKIKKARRP